MRAGLIGLGAMGRPMAENLARAGYLHAVWNRSRAAADACADATGAAVAANPADLAARCDAIVLCVSADDDVCEVVGALGAGVRAGGVVIDTSTVRPATARACAARLQAAGADFLDAPVSGGVEGARSATLSMMVGGAEPVLARVRPVLAALAERIVHFGPVGAGQAAKAVNQVMAAGINQAVSEALAFAQALELPPDRIVEALGAGAAGSWFLTHRGAGMMDGHFEPGFRVALHHKDLEICRDLARALDAHLPLVEMTLVHYRRLMDAGLGERDISALLREKQGLFRR